MLEREFVEKIRSAGGRVFIVGGYVRDTLLGRKPKDKDYVVSGLHELVFEDLLFDSGVCRFGNLFPVYHLTIDGVVCEVALARSEKKTGTGYRGFTVKFDPSTTIEEDLYRRDITINSMAFELPELKLIDPYNGQEAINDRIIVNTSKHFKDDPIRALRAARFAAELGFSITMQTYYAIYDCREELKDVPTERLMLELRKALASDSPISFFNILRHCNVLDITYPEIHALIGKKQNLMYHPEGDAYNHTMRTLDYVVQRTSSTDLIPRFAALVHDIGKGLTPEEELPRRINHVELGIEALNAMNRRMTLPKRWMKAARFVIEEHMRVPLLQSPGKNVDFLVKLDRHKDVISRKEFCIILEADGHEVPMFLTSEIYDGLQEAIKFVSLYVNIPSELSGKERGKYIREARIRQCRAAWNDMLTNTE
jgi:tRNA nucleotidyltransferase (CCA-adding enzyme)